MELKDILQKRRSTRKFTDRTIEPDVVKELIEATFTAPSSRNSHSTHLMAIADKAVIEKIATMRDYGSAFVKGAPLFVLVMGDKTATDMWEVNCSISATIMQLAATDLGLCSCWVHIDQRPQKQAEREGKMAEELVRELVDIPDHFGVLCGIAIGYSDFAPAPLPPFDKESHYTFVG